MQYKIFTIPILGNDTETEELNKFLLNKLSRCRFIAKYNDYNVNLETGDWNENMYQSHITPLLSFVSMLTAKDSGSQFSKAPTA